VFDDDRLSLAASRRFDGGDGARAEQIVALGEHAHIPLVAVNDVLYHDRGRRALQDVVTCIREGCTLATAGRRLEANGDRHLKSPAEMARLFADLPGAAERSATIAERAAAFSLDELRYEYPHEACPPGLTPMEHLRDLTWQGARERYPTGVPERVRTQVQHEFTLIEELAYAPYFLTVHDLVTFARSRDILCQGRGAAANSAVCYCLGVTAVDPDRIDVLFERFVSKERDEPPDIDIDFEHERREEVIQYIYGKYGRDRAALAAEVITYRGRSAMREVGKAMGFSLDCVDQLAKNVDWWHDGVGSESSLREIGLDPHDRSVRQLIALANEIIGFPRHLSQHVGGFVITQTPLCELAPIEHAAMEHRTVIEWDKDDIDAMNMLKVDCLGLGMLTCIRKAMAMVNDWDSFGSPTGGFENSKATAQPDEYAAHWPNRPLELHTIPPEDPAVYDMICAADTVGVFQIESRAQMSMLPRLRPRCYYDLVIEVAIVRPGPIQGDMVHPYLRRRNGEEPVEYPSEAVRGVLGKTLGVPLFQEQAMSLAVVAAGFSLGDADELRRSMAAWKRKGDQLEKFERKFLTGMLERGYPREFAERCFRQIRGFSEYGFPESHAASFALLVYASAWLKRHRPAAFAAGLINSQPMGFYAPSQIISDAEHHGVTVRAIDVNRSAWDCRLESPHVERLAFERLRQTEMNGAAVDGATGGALVDGHGRVRQIDPAQQGTTATQGRHVECGGGQPVLRLGMRLVKGLRQEDADRIAQTVAHKGPFDSLEELWRASGVRLRALRALARADAFQSMGLERQRALWIIRRLRDDGEDRLPIFDQAMEHKRNGRHASAERTEGATLPTPGPLRQVRDDYAAMHLSLKAHPMSFLRDEL
ncbi:MAG: error-prone DNA polymerase, partial [Pseudomonadales bacterium]|nr:error-prone DNA polymerase [Pseudomonadales bacterium]